MIHTVEFRETLYSVSRLYNAELNDIVVCNPSIINGLKVGYRLLVPLKKSYYKKFLDSKIDTFADEKVVDVNNNLNYSENTDYFISEDTISLNSYALNLQDSIINISLLLPFYLDLNDSLNLESNSSIYSKSKIGLDYYFGALMALDTLKSIGLKIDLNVYDIPNDSVFENLLLNNTFQSSDLIVGPLYIKQFHLLAEYYKDDDSKKIISPLSYKKVKSNYSNAFQVVPNENIQLSYMINYFNNNYTNSNLVIIGSSSEQDLIDFCLEEIKLKRIIKNTLPKPKTIVFDEFNRPNKEDIKQLLTENNIVLIPSNKRSFVSRVLPYLSSMKDTVFDVFGLSTWDMFDNLDIEDLNQLNTVFPILDSKISDDFSKFFITNYFENFHSFPSKYSFEGFKQFLYFNSKEYDYFYDFSKPVNNLGFVNFGLQLIKYQNYQRIKIY
jgi:hypothetical protein